MNGSFMPWGKPSVYQIQSWAKEYIVRVSAPWPKGLDRSNNNSPLINENSMW